MELKFKNNFLGYFSFYYGVLRSKVLINLGLGIVVSFLDGIGLAMFIPLLQSQAGGNGSKEKESMGDFGFLMDFIENLGFTVNINSILACLVILFVAKGAIKFVQLNYQVKILNIFVRKIRFSFVDHLQSISYQGFVKLDSGRVQNTLTAEVQRMIQSMKHYFNATQAGVMLLTYVVLAFFANYQFALFVAVGSMLSNLIYRKIYVATKKASVQVSKHGNDFNGFLIQALNHFKYLKATNYFRNFSEHLKEIIRKTEHLNKKMGLYSSITTSTKEPIVLIIVAGVIYIQLNYMDANLTSILLSLLLFYRALSTLLLVQGFWQNFIQGVGSMDAVTSLYNEMVENEEKSTSLAFSSLKNEIRFKDVSFSYDKVTVLKNINLSIPKNRTIALVGSSGSGKTTLANMVAGIINPDAGKMELDGLTLENYNLESYRSKIGYISQEAVIFNDSIFNNITFWAEPNEENSRRFWQTVQLASLSEFIKNQPLGEFTSLGDNGVLISGGQKQRISIARELYKNAEILILDEATSALDSETEHVIQENIEKLQGSYTMIIIAHRLSTIRSADVIYLLERGVVKDWGDFNSLLNSSEQFRRMVELQAVGAH